jgi:prepilin-type N-terminal cleavage/methylation domain-containing protein
MPSRSSGFTLLEVVLALFLLTIGLLALAGTLGPTAALAGRGRFKGRVALALESRLDRMRAELLAAAPACTPPAAGSRRNPDGVLESWSARLQAGLVEIQVEARGPGNSKPDTLVSRLPCP